MGAMLLTILIVAAVAVMAAVVTDRQRRPKALGRPDALPRRLLSRLADRRRVRRNAGTFRDLADPDGKVLNLADESGWTRPHALQLSPIGKEGQQTIRLGRPIDRTGAPLSGAYVYSKGSTPVGILGGSTGSGKTSGLLSPAGVMWGRDENGHLRGEGLPLLVISPKTELIEQCLKSRQAMNAPIAVWNVAGDAFIPTDLLPYLVSWTPLSEATTWMKSRHIAMAMCAGAGEGAASGGFWEKSAARILASAMHAVVLRGPGGTFEDVYDALTLPTKKTVRDEDGNAVTVSIPPIRALHDELADFASATTIDIGDGLYEKRLERSIGARYAAKAIADCVSGSETTIGSMINTATTAISAALIPGVANTPWDAPTSLNLKRHLIDTPGTVAVIGSVSDMAAARPFLSAFFASVKIMIEREAIAIGGQLRRQLLWSIDELTIVMGDGQLFADLLATARSHNVQVLYATQELASLDAAYGEALRTRIVNNTGDRLLLPNVACRDTLQLMSDLLGEYLATLHSYSTATNSGRTRAEGNVSHQSGDGETKSWSQQYRPLAPIGRLTKLREWEAVLVTFGAAAQLKVRPWFIDPIITSLVHTGQPPVPPAEQPLPR